jgi:hypothetical protein
MVQPASWLALGLCAGVGLLCYMGVLLGFCLQQADRADLRHMILKTAAFVGLKRK